MKHRILILLRSAVCHKPQRSASPCNEESFDACRVRDPLQVGITRAPAGFRIGRLLAFYVAGRIGGIVRSHQFQITLIDIARAVGDAKEQARFAEHHVEGRELG